MRRITMRGFTSKALAMMVCTLAGAGVALLGQAVMKPGHERVPPNREPSPYMSAAEIQTGLSTLDPKLVASRTGGAIDFAKGRAVGVVRRRTTGPQYAITHTRTVEYMIVIKGTGTLVTGGTLIPPTIDSDPYPNANPNATIRSDVGVKGGLARRIGPGDVVVNLPGTPHWLSQLDGPIDYFEIQIPNTDPAPGIERAEVLRAPAAV
jgi:mannose-6-phosphate isomerase-like protein (cupin superfamily)